MALWIILAGLTLLATLTVLAPLFGRDRVEVGSAEAGGTDLSVYRDQLSEIERDQARGLVADGDAEAARTEIARRLLRAAKRSEGAGRASSGRSPAWIAAAIVIAAPVLSFGLYLSLGSPGMPDQPLDARLNRPADAQSFAELVGRVERHLADNPEDGRGWEVIAPIYMRSGQYPEAETAYRNVLRILGATPARQTDLAEVLIASNQGIITQEARSLLEQAHDADPKAVRPRFFLAIALDQDGRGADALTEWRALLAEAGDGNQPWTVFAREQVARLASDTPSNLPGPSETDVAAASELSADDRREMIEGMVSGLRTRLESDGGTVEEWVRLVRSYIVLGRRDDALAVLKQARQAHNGDDSALAVLSELETALAPAGDQVD